MTLLIYSRTVLTNTTDSTNSRLIKTGAAITSIEFFQWMFGSSLLSLGGEYKMMPGDVAEGDGNFIFFLHVIHIIFFCL